MKIISKYKHLLYFMCLIFIVSIFIITTSNFNCVKDHKNTAKYEVIEWDIPKSYELYDENPLNFDISQDSKHVLFQYLLKTDHPNKLCSLLCFVELIPGTVRWKYYPYGITALFIKNDMVQIIPHTKEYKISLLDFNNFNMIMENIPGVIKKTHDENPWLISHSRYKKNDLWIYNYNTKNEYIFYMNQKDLENIQVKFTKDRLLIGGINNDPNTSMQFCTQLWNFPDFKKITEYITNKENSLAWSSYYPIKIVGKDIFCFLSENEVYKTANIHSGKELYVLGRSFTFKDRQKFGRRKITVFDSDNYTEDTGKLAWFEEYSKDKNIYIKTCDIKTGKNVQVKSIPKDSVSSLELIKVSGLWYILCEDENKTKKSIKLNLFQLNDLKTPLLIAEIPLIIHRIYKDGKIYLLSKNSIKIIKISEIIK